MRSVIIIIMAASLSANLIECALAQEATRQTRTGVILSPFAVENDLPRHETGALWMPTLEDIVRLENRLRPYLHGASDRRARDIAASLDTYKRQYIGHSAWGKRAIFVIGLCEEIWRRSDNWRRGIALIFDGGSCYFRVHFDVARQTFKYLEINN